MIEKSSFEKMQHLIDVDALLVNALVEVFSTFEWIIFHGMLSKGYSEYLNSDETTKKQFENLFYMVIRAFNNSV